MSRRFRLVLCHCAEGGSLAEALLTSVTTKLRDMRLPPLGNGSGLCAVRPKRKRSEDEPVSKAFPADVREAHVGAYVQPLRIPTDHGQSAAADLSCQ